MTNFIRTNDIIIDLDRLQSVDFRKESGKYWITYDFVDGGAVRTQPYDTKEEAVKDFGKIQDILCK